MKNVIHTPMYYPLPEGKNLEPLQPEIADYLFCTLSPRQLLQQSRILAYRRLLSTVYSDYQTPTLPMRHPTCTQLRNLRELMFDHASIDRSATTLTDRVESSQQSC